MIDVPLLETVWETVGYEDKSSAQKVAMSHNAAALRLMGKLRRAGYEEYSRASFVRAIPHTAVFLTILFYLLAFLSSPCYNSKKIITF